MREAWSDPVLVQLLLAQRGLERAALRFPSVFKLISDALVQLCSQAGRRRVFMMAAKMDGRRPYVQAGLGCGGRHGRIRLHAGCTPARVLPRSAVEPLQPSAGCKLAH